MLERRNRIRLSLLLHAALWLAIANDESHLCDGRRGAAPGSDVWCKCTGKLQLVRSKRVCETPSGGRSSVCQWSDDKGSCESNGQEKHTQHRDDIECPVPRGNHTQWFTRFHEKAHHLTVASWNVEWLFDGIADPTPVPSWVGDPEKVSERIQRIVAVLQRLDADIYHFAEVESCAVLSEIAARLNSSFEPFLVKGSDIALRQQVGLLSRLPPVKSLQRSRNRQAYPIPGSMCGHNDVDIESQNTGVSKHLVSSFSPLAGLEIVVIGLHFKAQPTAPSACSQREAQASVIRGIISDALQSRKHVIVVGDFNDLDPDVPGADGQIPTSSVLKILKDVDGDGTPELWNALEMVPRHERYTCWWDRDGDKRYEVGVEGSMIDHILISNSLRKYVVDVGIDHEHAPEHLSDHWPVWVRFDLSSWAAGAIDTMENGRREL